MAVVDHLILKARDLESGSAFLAEHLGVASLEGGRHSGFGTHNAIVPLGGAYLEILAVYDAQEAASNVFGRWALSRPKETITIDAVVLRTADLDSVCRRNGLQPVAMSRIRPDGAQLSWRLAGLDRAIADGLPAFIQWDVEDHLLPGASTVTHPGGDVALRSVEISGDAKRLEDWIGAAEGVSISEGPVGYSATFDTANGRIAI